MFFITIFSASRYAVAEPVTALTDDNCDCPKLSCNTSCEIDQDLTFYTEKCAGGSKVKSCSKPNCVKIANPPPSCGISESETSSKKSVGAESKREVASVADEVEIVGRVQFIEGSAKRLIGSTEKIEISIGDNIYEKDRIETSSTGKLQILFNSGNILNITPSSEVVITEASDSKSKLNQDKKRMLLDLIKGRVRNKVNQNYTGAESYYRVRTRTAVAGVRGTDFVMSAFNENEYMVSKIETFDGKVELSNIDLTEKVEIARGEGSSFVSPPTGNGHLTPIYKMSVEQVALLVSETDFSSPGGVKKTTQAARSSIEKTICADPAAKMNQCAWICEKNPVGEKTCRTDLSQVSCVRRICNANGEWSQPTRLPSSYSESCAPYKPIVKPCDY
ncbi:MAG: hypothetical protein A2Z20_04715 [Bdellovibrionales bacterium RBG_16_40_8]|nr:MAG: hypothetical protein A2Z20_04715 [Bdellovibrionales bacterium RBG_16_40_8]